MSLPPGYRQSPDPSRPMAITFVSLAAPDRDSSVTAAALGQAAECLRQLLGEAAPLTHHAHQGALTPSILFHPSPPVRNTETRILPRSKPYVQRRRRA